MSNQERETAEGKVWELFDAGFGEEEIASKAGVTVELVESILGDREEEYEDSDPREYEEDEFARPWDAADAAYEEEYGDDYMSDAEADADALASAEYGDEDYGFYGEEYESN